MKQHGIEIAPKVAGVPHYDDAGLPYPTAVSCGEGEDAVRTYGIDLSEALIFMAMNLGIRLWNEEASR